MLKDMCESILALNDYLSTVMPNLHQMSKSNLVQAKKIRPCNGSMHYQVVHNIALLNLQENVEFK